MTRPLENLSDAELIAALRTLETRPVEPALGCILIFIADRISDATKRCVTLDAEQHPARVREAQIERRALEAVVEGLFGGTTKMVTEEMNRRMVATENVRRSRVVA